jgi:hypothetical protein
MGKLKQWFKKQFSNEPEIIKQKVYDASYSITCPVCKTLVEGEEHMYENYKGELREPDKGLLMGCPSCGIAVWGKLQKVIHYLKTYEYRQESEDLMKLISCEEYNV